MARCPKHVPVPISDHPLDILGGLLKCANCGMEGRYSNGNRRFGRPRRIIWYRRKFARSALNSPPAGGMK